MANCSPGLCRRIFHLPPLEQKNSTEQIQTNQKYSSTKKKKVAAAFVFLKECGKIHQFPLALHFPLLVFLMLYCCHSAKSRAMWKSFKGIITLPVLKDSYEFIHIGAKQVSGRKGVSWAVKHKEMFWAKELKIHKLFSNRAAYFLWDQEH